MAKQPRTPRIPLPLSAIEEEFRAQLGLLRSSCERFDEGHADEFRRIALAVRIMVYDQGQSKSVMSQLGLQSVQFQAWSEPINERNMLPEWPLAIIEMKQSGGKVTTRYIPKLSDMGIVRKLSFDDWWSEIVFKAGDITMARRGFVLHVANQAGGAHVDPALDEIYHKIARENAAGFVATSPGEPDRAIEHLEKVSIRHIGFEVLKTLEPEWVRISGNRFCECGSGRKNRYCCGRNAATE